MAQALSMAQIDQHLAKVVRKHAWAMAEEQADQIGLGLNFEFEESSDGWGVVFSCTYMVFWDEAAKDLDVEWSAGLRRAFWPDRSSLSDSSTA
jgi:hypothetical protein